MSKHFCMLSFRQAFVGHKDRFWGISFEIPDRTAGGLGPFHACRVGEAVEQGRVHLIEEALELETEEEDLGKFDGSHWEESFGLFARMGQDDWWCIVGREKGKGSRKPGHSHRRPGSPATS